MYLAKFLDTLVKPFFPFISFITSRLYFIWCTYQ